jgi:ectoine hydroxylase-related dioxygenase (phytanoyl-CoA dioxygenase family)
MSPEEVRAIPPKVITAAQRESYFEDGYLHLEGVIPKPWVQRLQTALKEIIEGSRGITQSDRNYVLERGHQAKEPRLRRLNRAVNNYPDLWTFVSSVDSVLPDIVVDLLGPDVKFRDSQINFKLANGGEEVKWHQDTSHLYTNRSPLICCINFEDETLEQGPLAVVPGSQRLGQLNRFDDSGNWAGAIHANDLKKVDLSKAKALPGPAGSVTILHQFVVHGSARNDTDRNRALLVVGFDPGDAVPIHPIPAHNELTGTYVRGKQPDYVRVEAARLRLPPDWTQPEHQQHAMKGFIFGDKAPSSRGGMM